MSYRCRRLEVSLVCTTAERPKVYGQATDSVSHYHSLFDEHRGSFKVLALLMNVAGNILVHAFW